MKTITKTARALCAFSLITTSAAHAAITTVNPQGSGVISAGGDSSQTFSYDATGVEKLIVSVVAEENGTGPLGVPAVTFNGDDLTEAISGVDSSTGQQFAGIFYLDLPDQVVGDIVVDWGSEESNGSGIGVVGLTGAAAGGPVSTGTSTAAGGPVSLSPDPSAGDFAIVAFVTQGSTTDIDITSGTVTDLYAADVGSARGASSFEILGAGGPLNYSYTGASTTRPSGAAAVFTEGVIPEPSSLALLGLGGLMIARRRRAS
ncbi:MAG: PEP-CTERM sorting domain-containing protein [Planctomycetota bacterium]